MTRPLTVLHLGKYFSPFSGGIENYQRDLMLAQQQSGLQSLALVHRHEPGLRHDYQAYRQQGVELSVTRAALWCRILFTPISPGFPRLLRRLLKREQPDILHLHMPNVSVFWLLLLPAARHIPWVVHWHADVLASSHSRGLHVFYRFYAPLERAVLRRASAIIATSPPYLASSTPLQPFRRKCRIIPLGLGSDPGELAPPEPPQAGRLRVLAIGRLTYYKGFEYLLRACAAVPGVEVHLVGAGELQPQLTAIANELGLGERVTFYGHLPQARLEQQFAACDCLCLPSIERTEAFGLVLLEAMARGRATIASRVAGSGMGWVVDDGVTGLHCKPGDVDSLAQALARLRDDPQERRQLGSQAREKFLRNFSIARSADGIRALYDMLLAVPRDVAGEPENARG